jgi:uncharacterized protein
VPFQVQRSRWLYERRIAEGAWVVYVPHRAGLPAVVDELTHTLLEVCKQPLDVDEVICRARARHPSTPGARALRVLVAACSALGFLTDRLEPPRFRAQHPPRIGGGSLCIWLELTSRCNLSCSYCFVRKTDRDMSAGALERAVDAIVSTAVGRGVAEVDLRLAGGEPTLVMPIVEQAHELLSARLGAAGVVLRARVITNGTRVDRRLLTFLERSRAGVAVSLDGHGPAHDNHRRFKGSSGGSWALVSNNVDRFLAAGADVGIAATLSEDSCASLPRLLDWTVDRSLPVHLQWVSEPNRDGKSGALSPDDYRVFNDRLTASVEESLVALERRLALGEAVPDLTIDEMSLDEPQFGRCCGIGASYVAITSDGRVAICPQLAREGSAAVSDDLIEASSAMVRHSPACRNERDNDACLACQWFPVCVGGCSAINRWVCGDEFAPSPFCAFRRYVIPRYVEFLGRRLLADAGPQGMAGFRPLHPAVPGRRRPAPPGRSSDSASRRVIDH